MSLSTIEWVPYPQKNMSIVECPLKIMQLFTLLSIVFLFSFIFIFIFVEMINILKTLKNSKKSTHTPPPPPPQKKKNYTNTTEFIVKLHLAHPIFKKNAPPQND
jgi:hypothetical protein